MPCNVISYTNHYKKLTQSEAESIIVTWGTSAKKTRARLRQSGGLASTALGLRTTRRRGRRMWRMSGKTPSLPPLGSPTRPCHRTTRTGKRKGLVLVAGFPQAAHNHYNPCPFPPQLLMSLSPPSNNKYLIAVFLNLFFMIDQKRSLIQVHCLVVQEAKKDIYRHCYRPGAFMSLASTDLQSRTLGD